MTRTISQRSLSLPWDHIGYGLTYAQVSLMASVDKEGRAIWAEYQRLHLDDTPRGPSSTISLDGPQSNRLQPVVASRIESLLAFIYEADRVALKEEESLIYGWKGFPLEASFMLWRAREAGRKYGHLFPGDYAIAETTKDDDAIIVQYTGSSLKDLAFTFLLVSFDDLQPSRNSLDNFTLNQHIRRPRKLTSASIADMHKRGLNFKTKLSSHQIMALLKRLEQASQKAQPLDAAYGFWSDTLTP